MSLGRWCNEPIYYKTGQLCTPATNEQQQQ